MRHLFTTAAVAVALALSAAATAQAQITTSPAATQAGTYKLDPAHGKVTWSVTHFATDAAAPLRRRCPRTDPPPPRRTGP